ncbi:MAG: hypothetical protein KatS3mg032_0864 [Cyclobacteriaceae bacterium]|nr:MAG: hypothetical protein KatS3mg032_0864 [Cyclobacteriaceae bacterium]
MKHHEVLQLLLQLGIMLLAGRLFAEGARRLRQPAVAGEILAGILLGPTCLGALSPETFSALFPAGASALVLDGFVQIAVVMLLFTAGLEVDFHLVWQQGRQALITSTLGLAVPFFTGFIFPYLFPAFFGFAHSGSPLAFALFMGTAMAITALPVIARILMDLNLFKTRVGMLIISSAMVNDLIGWMIFSIVLTLIGKPHNMAWWQTFMLTLFFTVLMLTLGRGLANRVLPWINRKLAWPGGLLSLSLAFCFIAAAFTEFIGIHTVFGAFIFGVTLGDSEYMSERAKEIIHQFINNIFAPLFFVAIGLKVNFAVNFDVWLTLTILAIAFAGKIAGSGLGAWLGGLSRAEALVTGFGMNARGAMEIILGSIALDNHLINEKVFVALVIMALVTSITSGPLMKWSLSRKWK